MSTTQKIRKTILLLLFILFPAYYNYLSPALIVQASWEGIAAASLLFWSFFFITSIFIGRAGCSHFYPLGKVQELKNMADGDRYKRIRFLAAAKYIIFIIWAGAIIAGILASGGIKGMDLLYSSTVISVDSMKDLVRFYIVLSVPIIFAYFFGKMGFCHYICPFSIMNILGTKIKRLLKLPSLHLTVESSKCMDCKKCEGVCPMDVKVSEEVKKGCVSDASCILCGECSAICKNKVLKRKFGIEQQATGKQ